MPYLTTDITDFNGTAAQIALVQGGGMSLWGEYIDATNLLSRAFPRGSAVAEALWANPGAAANVTDATARMAAHTCRMIGRGIPAEPLAGPGYCAVEWQPAYNPPWGPGAGAL